MEYSSIALSRLATNWSGSMTAITFSCPSFKNTFAVKYLTPALTEARIVMLFIWFFLTYPSNSCCHPDRYLVGSIYVVVLPEPPKCCQAEAQQVPRHIPLLLLLELRLEERLLFFLLIDRLLRLRIGSFFGGLLRVRNLLVLLCRLLITLFLRGFLLVFTVKVSEPWDSKWATFWVLFPENGSRSARREPAHHQVSHGLVHAPVRSDLAAPGSGSYSTNRVLYHATITDRK